MHIIITATNLKNVPKTPEIIIDWLNRLVKTVNMEILIPPKAVRCDDLGNEGVTGIVCIKTSHASIHVWDSGENPFLKCDLYSCATFEPQDVIKIINLNQKV